MDKAWAYGAGDCRFESCRGHIEPCIRTRCSALCFETSPTCTCLGMLTPLWLCKIMARGFDPRNLRFCAEHPNLCTTPVLPPPKQWYIPGSMSLGYNLKDVCVVAGPYLWPLDNMPASRHRRIPTRRASQTHGVARDRERQRPRERERERERETERETERVAAGKLSSLDTDTATTARTHVQRARARLHNQLDYSSALDTRKKQSQQTNPKHTFMTSQGPRGSIVMIQSSPVHAEH